MASPSETLPPSYDHAVTPTEERPPLSSRSSFSVASGSSSRTVAVASAPTDSLVLVTPLQPSALGEPQRRWLPHLVDSVRTARTHKSSAQLVLGEEIVFIRPSSHVEEEGRPSGDVAGGDGLAGWLHGFFNVVSTSSKKIKGVRIRAVGRQRLVFDDGIEIDEVFVRELSLGAMMLEKGVNTYHFSILIPPSTPTHDRSKHGSILYHVSGRVLGTGSLFKDDISDRRDFWLVTSQADPADLRWQHYQHTLSPHLGPINLTFFSTHFTVSSPLAITLKLTSPPPNLTIFALNIYLQQTTSITSRHNPTKTGTFVGLPRYIVQEGEKGGYGAEGFAEKARKNELVFDGAKWKGTDEEWEWSKIARCPDDNQLRGTTLWGTKSDLRFSCRVVFQIVFNHRLDDGSEGQVNVATLYNNEVQLASCCCTAKSQELPTYIDEASDARPSMDWAAADNDCLCTAAWATLEKSARALMTEAAALEVAAREEFLENMARNRIAGRARKVGEKEALGPRGRAGIRSETC